jgi:hypothetical protein
MDIRILLLSNQFHRHQSPVLGDQVQPLYKEHMFLWGLEEG